jgi:hypothetical protein
LVYDSFRRGDFESKKYCHQYHPTMLALSDPAHGLNNTQWPYLLSKLEGCTFQFNPIHCCISDVDAVAEQSMSITCQMKICVFLSTDNQWFLLMNGNLEHSFHPEFDNTARILGEKDIESQI